ncbi:MAG: 50S ribosomal protein L22 [Fimbriimonas ginsengisoli]|uniref:Large ribosomal subunit protein uL22 n=1 Tax=Fimbriimonas ginsengisoli TaxID=1005039 RepID=A0A931LVK8_FIMGI|nr:50S ribosomal protein L22 [Fimbriimonas ginsengisoli]MBI3721458.1 50S ribosomal protein L22 [Fimbriimonas ginsengisoli]
MEVRAVSKYVRVQPRKVRIVADQVRGKPANQAAALLRYQPSKGARELRKTLMSAVANARENHDVSPEMLRISEIKIDEGPRLKRIIAKAQGRAGRILKKTSHITVVVQDYEPAARVKPHGTKAKPRPTLGIKTGRKRGAKATEAEVETPIEGLAAAEEPTVVESTPEPVAVAETESGSPSVEASLAEPQEGAE